MADILKVVGSVAPSVLSGWAAQYVGLFKQTMVFRPDVSDRTTNTTVAIGTVLAIVAALVGRSWPERRLVVCLLSFLILGFLTTAFGFWADYRIDYPTTRGFYGLLASAWNVTGPIGVVSWMLFVLFGTLYGSLLASQKRDTKATNLTRDSK